MSEPLVSFGLWQEGGEISKEAAQRDGMGIPLVKKDQIPDKAEPRNRSADPEKVRKRVAELLGTNDGSRAKSPAKRLRKRLPVRLVTRVKRRRPPPGWAEDMEVPELLEAH